MESKSKITVEIGSVDLKKLLCNRDGRVNLNVKNAIIQNFSKKYLKGVFDSEAKKHIASLMYSFVNKQIGIRYTEDNPKFNFYLKEKIDRATDIIVKEVENKLQKRASDITEKHVNAHISHWIAHYFRQKMRSEIENMIEEVIEKTFDKKYDEILTKKMLEKLK